MSTKTVQWGDIAKLEYGKSLQGYQDSDGEFPVYGTNGPIGRTNKYLCDKPGVIVGRKGAYRGIHYSKTPFFVIDTAFYLVPKSDQLDIRFAYYQLLTQDINGMDSGSAIPSTSRDDFYRLTIDLPPLSTQQRIADILSSLDDKIELNRKMNATLEKIAQAIYKHWFVDFEFQDAKGKPYRSSGGKMVDSEIGDIPEGWEVLKFSEAMEINPNRPLQKGQLATYLDMANTPKQGHRPDEVIQREFTSGTRFTNGDTLLARITPCLEHGKTAFVDFLKDDEVGWGSTEFIVMYPRKPLSPEYVYLLARSSDVRKHAIQNMSGSSGRQRVQVECFDNFFLPIGPELLIKTFSEIIAPIFKTIAVQDNENKSLTKTRDRLLPKLMSGKIAV